jgi:uncharacterized protein YdeI (YjbR/CyaY-like superfamily)
MTAHNDRERVHPETVQRWRDWLAENHGRAGGVWLVSWKSQTKRPRLTYEESVEEALAFGWVDSKALSLDDERTMLWFAPRKATSGWSRPNKERVARLEADGRMTDAGRRVIEAARANGSWTLLDAVEDLIVPDDLAAALDAHAARAAWDEFPRSVRRAALEWIVQARRPETRAKRVALAAERTARGDRPT